MADGLPAKIIIDDFTRFVTQRFDLRSVPDSSKAATIAVHEAGLETVTLNGANGLRTGLHVDDWSMLPLALRARAPSRLCANFGWNDRYLLYVDVPLDELATGKEPKLETGGHEALRADPRSAIGGSELVTSFFNAFPSYPVCRLRVRPGEAYIAPTDNLIHDGSSAGGRAADVACHVWVNQQQTA